MPEDEIRSAINILNRGGIIIFPTDTAFGIGCRIDNPDAVKKLFLLRHRPAEMAVPVLVSSIKMAEKYLLSPLPDNVRHLMNDFWPGGLTVLLPCRTDSVTPLVRADGNNLGVRMPDHQKILKIIKEVGVPILAPSANFHRDPTPYSFEELNPELVKKVDFAVTGECKFKQASSVIDCSRIPWKIIRRGTSIINLNSYV